VATSACTSEGYWEGGGERKGRSDQRKKGGSGGRKEVTQRRWRGEIVGGYLEGERKGSEEEGW
jgi:hypothetical protein